MASTKSTKPAGLIKIGEMADVCGISQRTLRYYEELKLIAPERSDGGVRLYSGVHVARIREVLKRIRDGESLGSIILAESQEKTPNLTEPPPPRSSRRLTHREGDEASAGRYFKIGNIAKRLQTTVRTVRYYEEEGVIAASRSEGGTRFYSLSDYQALQTALTLTRLGLDFKVIKRLASGRKSCRTGDEGSRLMSGILEEVRAIIAVKLALYMEFEKDIDRVRLLVRQCRGCENAPTRAACPTCPMERNLDQSKLAQLIWERT